MKEPSAKIAGNKLVLEGEWDLSRKAQLMALLGLLNPDSPATVDLRGVTYADSSFLAGLAWLRREFGEVPITLVGPNARLQRVLKIVSFDKVFQIVEDDNGNPMC